MSQKLRLIGYCGLYCGACYDYRSSFLEGKHLLEEAVKQGKNPDSFTCGGCRGETEYTYPGCKTCKIRTCAEEKGLVRCGLCSSFPCEKLIEFQHDKQHIHHLDVVDNLTMLKEKEPELWLKEQKGRWTCKCGMPFSWYETKCVNCGLNLTTYATNLRKARG